MKKDLYAAVAMISTIVLGAVGLLVIQFMVPDDTRHRLAVDRAEVWQPAPEAASADPLAAAVQAVSEAAARDRAMPEGVSQSRERTSFAEGERIRARDVYEVSASEIVYRTAVETDPYSNVRRYLEDGHLPPSSAVNIEEIVNHFSYGDPEAAGGEAVSVTVELGDCPWNKGRKIAMVAVRAARTGGTGGEGCNFVLLTGASGAVDARLLSLIDSLRAHHSVTVVTGHAGLEDARKHFIAGRDNRVILSKEAFTGKEVERLTAQGHGEKVRVQVVDLSDVSTARKTLVSSSAAREVKIDVRFNPSTVKNYRLIGYEDRAPNSNGLSDDGKDVGRMEAGRSVAILYEIEPADAKAGELPRPAASPEEDILTVKVQYRAPEGDAVRLIAQSLTAGSKVRPSVDIEFASAVAEFGLLLRNAPEKASLSYDSVIQKAAAARGADEDGRRAEFVGLVKTARILDSARN